MADWFCSSAAYTAISAFVASHAYSIGDIIKPTAPALKALWTFRCTTAGTSSTEPSWPTGNGATVTSGGATFTNVTGVSTYGWGAAAGDLQTIINTARFAAGDRVFVSSDHTETQTTNSTYGSGTNPSASYTVSQILSVNRAGSVPPVAADLAVGASFTCNSQFILETFCPVYHYGVSYINTGGNNLQLGNSGNKTLYFEASQIFFNTTTANLRIATNNPSSLVLYNSTIRFGATSQGIGGGTYPLDLTWLNTPNAIATAGSIPNPLFPLINNGELLMTARGVDFSAVTGTLVNQSGAGAKYLFDSCRIAPAVTRYNNTSVVNTRDLVELINCFDGTSIINESYQPAGSVVTERTITLSGGATDDVGVFSHKLVSGTNVDKYVNPLVGFWMDVENTAVGSSKTATVEIISSLTLNNDDISLLLEYQGTTGSSLASFANTLPATVLTTNAAVTASTATWNASPATPVKQKLVITFTPRVAGRVRGQVRLGRASTTVYVNPVIAIT